MSTLTIKSPKSNQISINVKRIEKIVSDIYSERSKKDVSKNSKVTFTISKKAAKK
jgi:hypothetical protein